MPFELLETQHLGKQSQHRKLASIQYRRRKSKDGDLPLPQLIVGIPEFVLLKMPTPDLLATIDGKPTGNSVKRFTLMLGTGDDAGKGLITENNVSGAIRAVVIRKGVFFPFGYVPYLGNEAAAREFVQCTALSSGFMLELPAWFKPAEDKPDKPAVEQLRPFLVSTGDDAA